MASEGTTPKAAPRVRHIADTMSTSSSAAEIPLPGTPRLTATLPIRPPPSLEAPLPVPTSTYTTYPRFQPRCGHLHMVRVYGNEHCNRCFQRGPFGWLYRCTEHRESIIDDRHRLGFTTTFDNIGAHFANQMSLGKRGPDMRQDRNSLFREMTEEQLHAYTPAQLITLLDQREQVWTTAEHEMRAHAYGGRALLRFTPLPKSYFADQAAFEEQLAASAAEGEEVQSVRPRVPGKRQECEFKVCHRYYRGAADKSWLSLNGVLNGDVPPTAATAYSFAQMKQRPVCSTAVVSRLGLRAVPLPRDHPARRPMCNVIELSDTEDSDGVQVIEYHAHDAYDPSNDEEWTTTDDDDGNSSHYSSDSVSSAPTPPTKAEQSKRRTLRRCTTSWSIPDVLAWSNGTRRASPEGDDDSARAETEHLEHTSAAVPEFDGTPMEYPPCVVVLQPEGVLAMDFVAEVAAQVPLPVATFEEEWLLGETVVEEEEGVMDMAGRQLGGCEHFGSEPPRVAGAIAVREEAEEVGLADLVAQV